MSIISSDLVKKNLNFAIANISVTLTAVTPTNAEIYVCNKQDIDSGFTIFEDGREETLETRFFLNKTLYTTLPTKGMILTDGTKNYKVVTTSEDALNVNYKIDCSAEAQRN
jgi:hypothetical protein